MRDLVRAGKSRPAIRDKAVNVTFYIPRNAWVKKAQAIWGWVKSNVRYVPDINGVETLHWPEQTMAQGFGDCDDQATLVAALFESIGMPTRLVAVGFAPGIFQHVYSEVMIGSDWVAMETTEDEPFGWKPEGVVSAYIVRN